jgi:hypothetical protein
MPLKISVGSAAVATIAMRIVRKEMEERADSGIRKTFG